ncbi:hypothetical protein M3596_22310, partial [Bacillus subtilis]|uniref:hypothetical protein n=1 Tax=Bacillus subtilis TaxID=1423 RepID=UPI00203FA21D
PADAWRSPSIHADGCAGPGSPWAQEKRPGLQLRRVFSCCHTKSRQTPGVRHRSTRTAAPVLDLPGHKKSALGFSCGAFFPAATPRAGRRLAFAIDPRGRLRWSRISLGTKSAWLQLPAHFPLNFKKKNS